MVPIEGFKLEIEIWYCHGQDIFSQSLYRSTGELWVATCRHPNHALRTLSFMPFGFFFCRCFYHSLHQSPFHVYIYGCPKLIHSLKRLIKNPPKSVNILFIRLVKGGFRRQSGAVRIPHQNMQLMLRIN